MNLLDRMIAPFAPGLALQRERSRQALSKVLAHYDAASNSDRVAHRRAPGTDADAAASRRQLMAFRARDMVRNTPLAARAQQVITNNIVGDGVLPKLRLPDSLTKTQRKRVQARVLQLIERDLDTTGIDADGRQTLYGLQRLAINTVVDAGEVLVVRVSARYQPLKVRVLEPDYIDTSRQSALQAGGWVRDGIEYDAQGRRVAYWLFNNHPGSDNLGGRLSPISQRVPAADVLHVFRQDRPGQARGVTWFAPIAIALADLDEFQDAELVRHKVASCLVGVRVAAVQSVDDSTSKVLPEMSPGLIMDIGPEESMTFNKPPDAGDFDPFTRAVLRSIASGLGVTYEALTGDLSNVTFSSGRMGRIEMDRNVSSWQWTMLIPNLLQPLGRWIVEGWMKDLSDLGQAMIAVMEQADPMEWVPPHKVLVDPTREIPALVDAVRAGLASRVGVVRSLGYDPERLDAEIAADNARMDEMGLRFESDFRHALTPLGRVLDGSDGEAGPQPVGAVAKIAANTRETAPKRRKTGEKP